MKHAMRFFRTGIPTGPHTVWANANTPGGEMESENGMMDNFNSDPNAGLEMIRTAEKMAHKMGIPLGECDEATLRIKAFIQEAYIYKSIPRMGGVRPNRGIKYAFVLKGPGAEIS